MLSRFEGDAGSRRLAAAIRSQLIVGGNANIADALSTQVEVMAVRKGDVLIHEGGADNDLFFILTGSFNVSIKGRHIATRPAGYSVGEMAAIDISQPRSATVTAAEDSVVARLPEPSLNALAQKYPDIWRNMAIDLARRLNQRGANIQAVNEHIRVFIISSKEALPIAQEIQSQLSHEDFIISNWPDGVFKASNYVLEGLEKQVSQSDIAIAIAHPDDLVEARDGHYVAPRDNVTFELGYFMGHLGRKRALLMEPRREDLKMPSDLSGLTTIPYKYLPGQDLTALLAPACHALRKIIKELGPRT